MSSPHRNRATRFEERTEVFQYTDTKDDEWLLGSPCEVRRNEEDKHEEKKVERDQPMANRAIEPLIPMQIEEQFEDPQIQNLKRLYLDIKENRTQNARNQREEMMKAKEEEQRKAKEEDARRQEELRLEVENQRIRQAKEREEKVKLEQAQRERLERAQLHQHQQRPAQNHPPEERPRGQKDRVTLNINEWLKFSTEEPPIIIGPAPLKVQLPRNTVHNNRITLDLKGISSLFQENFNKYESIASNKSRQSINRKSLSYRTANANSNSMAFQQYFQTLEAQPSEAELAEQHYFTQLEQQSEKRLRECEQKTAKLQEQLKELQAQLASLPQQPDLELPIFPTIEASFEPAKRFFYNFRIQLLQIDTSQHDQYTVYSEFILDEDLFCKLRRDDRNKPAEIRMVYNSYRDAFPSEALIDMNSRIQLLKLYFARLDRLPTYRLLEQLGLFYNEFAELQDDLAKCCSIFNIRTMELSRSCDKITFEITVRPRATVLVTLHLLQLLDAKYYEFYHIQASREIVIPEEKLAGDDLIDILEAMSDCL